MQLDLHAKPVAATAFKLATKHHEGITRLYNGEPYINHPMRVAETLLKFGLYDDNTLAAALLHDCVEDKNASGWVMSLGDISRLCNARVARDVGSLTAPKRGKNRAERKRHYNEQLAQATRTAKAIKCADIIDNIKGIVELDPKFAEVYLKEKKEQVKVLAEVSLLSTALFGATVETIEREEKALALYLLEQHNELAAEEKAFQALVDGYVADELAAYAMF